MASPISFQGLSTNLPTDKLIEAILQQEGAPVERMQARQAQNSQRSSLLRSISSSLTALNTSLGSLNTTAFEARSVTSTDANGTYVTAAANQAASGTYDVTVSQVATKARLAVSKTVASTTGSLGGTADGDGKFAYTVTNKDGAATTYQLDATSNTLAGLRDAINAKSTDTGVSASIVQTSAAGGSYQLVLSATKTGTGTAAGDDGKVLKLQVNAGSGLDTGRGAVYTSSADERAQNALFTVNGIQVERASNTVSDVVDGVTFTLKKGDGGVSTTSFTVGVDKDAITKSLQEVVDKFNAVYKLYKDNSATGKPLAGDSSIRGMLSSVRGTLTLQATGVSADNDFQAAASLGLKTNRDGTLSLDSTAFKNALVSNPTDAAALFSKVGDSVSTLVGSLTSPGSGDIAMIIQSLDSQNTRLNRQISTAQERLERRRITLQTQYANLEATIGKLQSAGQSLSGLR